MKIGEDLCVSIFSFKFVWKSCYNYKMIHLLWHTRILYKELVSVHIVDNECEVLQSRYQGRGGDLHFFSFGYFQQYYTMLYTKKIIKMVFITTFIPITFMVRFVLVHAQQLYNMHNVLLLLSIWFKKIVCFLF